MCLILPVEKGLDKYIILGVSSFSYFWVDKRNNFVSRFKLYEIVFLFDWLQKLPYFLFKHLKTCMKSTDFHSKKMSIFVQKIGLRSGNFYICIFAFIDWLLNLCSLKNFSRYFIDSNIWLILKNLKDQNPKYFKESFSHLDCLAVSV